VDVVVTADAGVVAAADLAIVPGSRSTVHDLSWLRRRSLDAVLASRARRQAPVLGICGGYQMLATTINDPIESGCGSVEGLGLLPATIDFSPEKILGRPHGSWHGHDVVAYEIHHGVARVHGQPEAFLDGCRVGQVWGTMWHGTLEQDGFRRAWLGEVARASDSAWRPVPGAPSFASRREAMIDTLADAIERHLDLELIIGGTR
jgi:adenosylcobyric acid synthase